LQKYLKHHHTETLKKLLSIFEKQQYIASLVKDTKKSTSSRQSLSSSSSSVTATAMKQTSSAADKLTAIAEDLVTEIEMIRGILALLQ
jgi:hypothetical protein